MVSSGFIISSQAAPKQLLATAMGLALMSSGGLALAVDVAGVTPDADAADRKADPKLETIEVEGQFQKEAASPKYTGPMLDTPQTVTIVPKAVIEGQNLLRLQDILSTLPGITFGAGEGGGGYGDSINLRGFSANNDIAVDGVRDSAQYSRTDPFNLEQVEVTNGANSVYSGAGSVGGSINLVSKAARAGDRTSITAGVGSDSYARTTLDTNQQFGEHTAFRLNVMAHRNDVPGRDVEEFKRWGIAPSITFGLGTGSTATLSYVHQKDDNIPQYGVPFYNGSPLPGVDPSNYYGYSNVDKQEITTDAFTAIINHEFSENFSLRNLSRVSEVDQLSLVDAVQGTWCLPNNRTPTGASCVVGTGAAAVTVPIGQYLPSGPRGYLRETTNKILANQTDFTIHFNTGGLEHNAVVGTSLSHESFALDVASVFRNADGSNPYVAPAHLPFMDLYNPNSVYTGPYNRTLTGKTDGEQDNAAVYAFDTIKFSPQWELNLGARFERNEGTSTNYIVSTAPSAAGPIGTITGANAPTKNNDDLFSYRGGLVFKPVENASIYFAYGNSKTPSKASVNGSCTQVTPVPGAPITGANNCSVDPETAVSYELGSKWDVLDGALSLTGSIFRNDRKNYRVADPDPTNVSGEQALDGQARVDGVLIGAVGKLTDKWLLSANYAWLDSEVIRGVSQYSAGLGLDYTKGDPLLNTPEQSLSFWTTYEFAAGWQIGYGATYQGDNTVQQHSATYVTGKLAQSPDYWLQRAMVSWQINRQFGLQFNINNLGDKEYYTRIRNNGWATPGDGRSYTLTASYNF